VVRDGDILPTAAVRKVLVDCGVPGRPHHFTRLFIGGSLVHAGMAPADVSDDRAEGNTGRGLSASVSREAAQAI
jgi:hypothetical protein